MTARVYVPVFLLLGMLLAGCRLAAPRAVSKSALPSLVASPETVSLQIFSARYAETDRGLQSRLWSQIDEQQLPIDVRRQMAEEGFRAGVIGDRVPDELSTLLNLTGERPPEDASGELKLHEEPNVTMNYQQIRAGDPIEVQASQRMHEGFPLLWRDGDYLSGTTLRQAQCGFSVRAFPQSDGRVKVEITPEIQHGEPKRHYVGDYPIVRLEMARPKKVFEQLRFSAMLGPGQMIIMSAAGDQPSSLGCRFFSEPEVTERTQKLIVIRLAQAMPDAAFDVPKVASTPADATQ